MHKSSLASWQQQLYSAAALFKQSILKCRYDEKERLWSKNFKERERVWTVQSKSSRNVTPMPQHVTYDKPSGKSDFARKALTWSDSSWNDRRWNQPYCTHSVTEHEGSCFTAVLIKAENNVVPFGHKAASFPVYQWSFSVNWQCL